MTVIDIKTGKRIQSIQTAQVEPSFTPAQVELFERIRDLIDEQVEAMDRSFCDDSVECLYFDILADDREGVLGGFLTNYRESECIAKICFNASAKQEGAEAIREALANDELLIDLLIEHSSVEPLDDIYIQWNELTSLQVGEYEHQLDIDSSYCPELTTILAGMDDSDINTYNRWHGCSYNQLSRGYMWVIGRPCERVILKLDDESFESAVKSELKSRKKKQSKKK